MDYEIIILSNRPHLSQEAQACLRDLNNRIFNGTNYPSFSRIVNDAIASSLHEQIIICNDKARPTYAAVEKILTMLKAGWGLVGLYRFGFFGFKKDLIRKIGFFDEGFIGGGYEDNDFIWRLKEANISLYESEEIDYIYLPTSWHYEKSNFSRNHFYEKWKEEGNVITRQLPEKKYQYDIGPFQNSKFTEFSQSILLPYNLRLKDMIMNTHKD